MDYWDEIEVARSRLRVMSDLLRQVEKMGSEPIGPVEAGLYADWCDAVSEVLARL